MTEEQEYWRRLLDDLNERFTLEVIATRIGLSVSQISNIKNGDRPTGLAAVRLFRFHMEHRTTVPETGTTVPSFSEGKA